MAFKPLAKSNTMNLAYFCFGGTPKKTEACHDQQRNDTEKADGYNNGECAGAFHFALDGSHSWNVTQFSDLFSVLLGHNKGVAVRERNDHQRYDHQ